MFETFEYFRDVSIYASTIVNRIQTLFKQSISLFKFYLNFIYCQSL